MPEQQQLVILFGLPGAGKTYAGQLLQREFGYFFYDGDTDLTDRMKDALTTQTPFTDDMRDEFFTRLLSRMRALVGKYRKLVVAQTFIKEKYRERVFKDFPHVTFILVTSHKDIRLKRLRKRRELPLTQEYIAQMDHNFEDPQLPHILLMNNTEGSKLLLKQLRGTAQFS